MECKAPGTGKLVLQIDLLFILMKESSIVYAFSTSEKGKLCLILKNAFTDCPPRQEPGIAADQTAKFHIDFHALWILSFIHKITLSMLLGRKFFLVFKNDKENLY